ncbi:MAG: methyltransferase [Defluviitaleaceae bacterium]|nr:methyltransferase [Defluviitaleaceae bacterium]
MSNHYFSSKEPDQSNPQTYFYKFGDTIYEFVTDIGIFSVGKMDPATDILLRNIPPLQGSLLDMGCGCGCIGIVLAKEYDLELTQADVNPRAVRLTIENAARNGINTNVVQSDLFSKITGLYDTVVINPPIHAGKNVIFSMYKGAYDYLKPGGSLYVVILKKHGAESTIKQFEELFGSCHILYKKKGCYVLSGSK